MCNFFLFFWKHMKTIDFCCFINSHSVFSWLMECSFFFIELANTLCCHSILYNSQSHFSAKSCQIEILKILCRLLTLNWISLFELRNGIGCQPSVCVCACVFVRGWLQVRVTVGGWVAASRRVLWFVCVGALCSCWDLLEGRQGNMYFNPWVYCHSKKPIKFYDLAAGGSFPCAWRAWLIYIDVSFARYFQRASIHGMLTGLTYLVSI